jgi:hypothetical protein
MARTTRRSSSRLEADEELIVRGSLIRLRRRCGKRNCRCYDGQPHLTWALSYSLKGKTRMLTLRDHDLSQVRRALARHARAMADLEKQALRGINNLSRQVRQAKRKETRS